MRLAVFAAKDFVGVQVGVVDEAHAHRPGGLWPESARLLDSTGVGNARVLARLGQDAEVVRWCGDRLRPEK